MSGLWLASYVLLWLALLILGVLVLGTLRMVGRLTHDPAHAVDSGMRGLPRIDQDGPPLRSLVPDLVIESANSNERIRLIENQRCSMTLFMFMSTLCEGCQEIVEPLNVLALRDSTNLRTIAILRGNEPSCRAFLTLFPLQVPTVFDADAAITDAFHTHHSPYGLLYDANCRLVRKGSIGDASDLSALLGSASVPIQALANVYPSPVAPVQVSERGSTSTRPGSE